MNPRIFRRKIMPIHADVRGKWIFSAASEDHRENAPQSRTNIYSPHIPHADHSNHADRIACIIPSPA